MVDEFVGITYTNHNPQGIDGPDGLKRFITFFRSTFPDLQKTTYRILAEDDLVVLHSESIGAPGATPNVVVDVFRVQDGQVVEHWDVIQPVPEHTVGDHDLFTTLSAPAVNSPDPDGRRAEHEGRDGAVP